jgi:hypothetical protein
MVNLTQEQIDALHGAEIQVQVIEREINRAEEAGLDVKDLRAQLAEVEKVRRGLLKVYGGVYQRKPIG